MRKLTVVLSGLAILAAGGAATGGTYWVDASRGDDAAVGSQAAPWKTISRGVKDLKPGDTLLIGSGVYRETVEVAARGTADAPITIKAAPGARALVTGADPVAAWTPCTRDDAGGNPNFRNIRHAEIDWQPTALYDRGRQQPLARSPREGWWTCTGVTDTTLTDTVNLRQTRDVWAATLVTIRLADGNTTRRVAAGFDPNTSTLRLNRPLPADRIAPGKVAYWMEGRVAGIDRPGAWAGEPVGPEGQGKWRVFHWRPERGGDSEPPVELPRRTHQVDLSKAAHVTVEGLEIGYGAMPERAGECAVGASVDANDPAAGAGLVVRGCVIHDHRRFGAWFQGCKKPRLTNSLVYNCGWGVMLAGNEGAVIEMNDIGPNIVDGFRDTYGGRGTVFRRNYIHHHFDSEEHADNVQLHNDVRDITFQDNLVLCAGQSFMMAEANGVTFRNNVIVGSAANMIICGYNNTREVVFERNTCSLGAGQILALAGGTSYRFANNILVHTGGSLFYAVPDGVKFESDHNLFWIGPGLSPKPWRAARGAFSSLAELQKAAPLEAHSQQTDPKFASAPVLLSTVQHYRDPQASTPGKLAVGIPGMFRPGDHVEVNFDGVVRTVKAVQDKAILIDPPVAKLTVFIFVANWKDKTDFRHDYASPLNDKYGSTINVPAYMKGDFDGDGRRDVPDRPKD